MLSNLPSVTMASLLENRQPQLPALLQCGERTCEVLSLLRFFPDRRAVFSARFEGQEVILKVYANHPKAHRELAEEQRVLRGLQAKGIAAPAIVASLEEGEERALVMAHLGEQSAKSMLASLSAEQQSDLILALVAFTGQMHAAGVMQEDIHLDNFLFFAGQWYAIDAGGVILADRIPLKKRQENLALLLAQFPPLTLPPVGEIIGRYRQEMAGPDLVSVFSRVRERRLKRLVKKSLRDCSEFVSIAQGGLVGMARRQDKPLVDALLIAGLDSLLETSDLLKDGNSATVGRVTVNGESLVIKRYNVKSAVKSLGRQFRSRARNSWMNAAYLGLVHVATPQAVCYLSSRKGGLKGREYLVCRSVSGEMLPALCEQGGDLRPSVLKQMADFFVTMELVRFSHGDSKYTNFIFQDGQLQVLDLDGMTRHPGRRLDADLEYQRQRLFKSWKPREALAPAAEEEFLAFYHGRKAILESWL